MCAKSVNKKCKLGIISDCSQSGNWVKLYKNNKNKFGKHIKLIQASSKENKLCNAGTFISKYAQCCFHWIKKKEINAAQGIGAVLVGGLGVLMVGSLYDGVFKQPLHKATKQSQPISTEKSSIDGIMIGYSRDSLYEVVIYTYNSWYEMDLKMTAINGATAGSAGFGGFY
eukprot:236054_1